MVAVAIMMWSYANYYHNQHISDIIPFERVQYFIIYACLIVTCVYRFDLIYFTQTSGLASLNL